MTKMNETIKQNWVTALRSGKYEQAFGSLSYDDNGKMCYCALGVLCVANDLPIRYSSFQDNLLSAYEIVDISDLNDGTEDSRTHDFDYIADWVERYI